MIAGRIILLFYAIIGIWIYKTWKKNRQEYIEENTIDAIECRDLVNEIAAKIAKLEKIDDMIIDLRVCKPGELHKGFRMEWMSEKGEQHSLDFMADGKNIDTENLLRLAYQRRDELNEDIINDLLKLCKFMYVDE